jgi:hypothetical protein
VGFYFRGFAQQSSNPTDHVTVTYSCQYTHNLYLGTSLSSAGGELTTTLDGVAQPTIDAYADATSPISTRRLIHPDHRARSLLRREVRTAVAIRRKLRDVLLHAGHPVPAGRTPQSRGQSALAVPSAGWLGPRPPEDGGAVLGIDLPKPHERAGGDHFPGDGQLARDRDGVPGTMVQRRLSLDDGVRLRAEPVDSDDLPLGLRPPLPVQLAAGAASPKRQREVLMRAASFYVT